MHMLVLWLYCDVSSSLQHLPLPHRLLLHVLATPLLMQYVMRGIELITLFVTLTQSGLVSAVSSVARKLSQFQQPLLVSVVQVSRIKFLY